MGITATVAKALEALRKGFLSGSVSEHRFKRTEEHLLTYGIPSSWAEPVQRPAAKSAGTRQNLRREAFQYHFERLSAMYPGEPRSVRRTMARNRSKLKFQTAAA